jgi:hypothetical protein
MWLLGPPEDEPLKFLLALERTSTSSQMFGDTSS